MKIFWGKNRVYFFYHECREKKFDIQNKYKHVFAYFCFYT